MPTPVHPRYMERALRRAREGRGTTGTNPLVGACLVGPGGVLAEAAHRRFGGPHAEAHLLSAVDEMPPDGVLYVTLEPCVHDGKTPACVPRLVERGPARVVYAHRDPDPRVDGRGLETLRSAGIRVVGPLRRPEYRWLNRAYFHRQATGRPWVELKLATSADGRIALSSGESRWITGEASRARGHRLRSRVDAVMVGAKTLRRDDPRLTDRVTDRTHQPRAVVVARRPEALPAEAHLFTQRADATVVLLPENRRDRLPAWLAEGPVAVQYAPTRDERILWPEALKALTERHVGRLLVEGGGYLAGTLLEAGMVNELHLFYSGRFFGDGVPSVGRDLPGEAVSDRPRARLLEVRRFGEDVYVRRLFYDDLVSRGVPDGFVSGIGPAWIERD